MMSLQYKLIVGKMWPHTYFKSVMNNEKYNKKCNMVRNMINYINLIDGLTLMCVCVCVCGGGGGGCCAGQE